MEYLLENILNMVGFLVGLCIGLASYLGYKNTGSPVLFRMSVAFLSIAIGFFVIWMGYVAKYSPKDIPFTRCQVLELF